MNRKSHSSISPKLVQLLFIFLLFQLLYISYSNTFYSPPVLDDYHSFIDEPLTRVDHWTVDRFLDLSKTKFSWKRWIPMVTFGLDMWLGQGRLVAFHVTNFCIHLCCVFAVLFLVLSITKFIPENVTATERLPAPLVISIWVAGIWALSPLQTNAVTYLVQRMTSIASLFYVLSVACYIAARFLIFSKDSRLIRTILLFSASFISMILAFFSKENSAMIPIMLVLTEFWFFQPKLFHRGLRFCLRHWILTGICIFLAIFIGYDLFYNMLSGYSGRHFTLIQRLLTETRVIVFYISLLIWPHPNRLSLEHHVELSTSVLSPLSTLFSILILAFLIWWTVSRRLKYPVITYGVLWFFVNLLIESTVVPLELVFEHRLYLPSIGFFLTLIAGSHRIFLVLSNSVSERDFKLLSWCIVTIVFSLSTVATFQRNEDWADILALSRDDASKQPKSPRARANYAVALARSGSYEDAIKEAETAIKLGRKHYEDYGVAANTIVLSHYNRGDLATVIREGEKFLANWPSESDSYVLPSVYLTVANAHLKLGDLESAFRSVEQALVTNQRLSMRIPQFELACIDVMETIHQSAIRKGIDLLKNGTVGFGNMCVKNWAAQRILLAGDRQTAKKLLKEVVQERPHDHGGQRLLEALIEEDRKNEYQRTNWSFHDKYTKHPYSIFNASMAVAFLVREKPILQPLARIGEAVLNYALELQPDSADAHLLKGWYHYEKEESEEAITRAKFAIQLAPDYAKAWLGLGFFLAKENRRQEAIESFQKTLELYPGYPQRHGIQDIIAQLQSHAESLARNDGTAIQ